MKFRNESIAHSEHSIFLHVNVREENSKFKKIYAIFMKFTFAKFAIQFMLNQFF